jgi:hypothetical protein
MTQSMRLRALEVIHQTQADTASVTVQIGGVDGNNQVEDDTLYVKDCPAAVIDALRDEGFVLSMGDDGLKVLYQK